MIYLTRRFLLWILAYPASALFVDAAIITLLLVVVVLLILARRGLRWEMIKNEQTSRRAGP